MFSALDEQSEICTICGWQNDVIDLEEMYQPMGPNHVSLEEAQKNFAQFGAAEQKHVPYVQKPTENDVRDPKWRPLDRSMDKPRKLGDLADTPDAKLEDLYYWYWN